jgi:HEAT repeat protein
MAVPDVRAMESRKDVGGLIKALGFTDSPTIPEEAAYAIGRVCVQHPSLKKERDTRPVKPLLGVLADRKRPVGQRAGAAFALGFIWGAPFGGDPHEDRSTVDGLLAVAGNRSDDEKVRHQAIKALRDLGVERAYPTLLGLVEDTSESSLVRIVATTSLGHLGGEQARGPLVAALTDSDEGVRGATVVFFNSPVLRDASVVEALVSAFGTLSALAKCDAAKALGEIGNPRATEVLVGALQDEGYQVRIECAKALGSIGDQRAVEPLAALRGQDPRVDGDVEQALATLRSRTS